MAQSKKPRPSLHRWYQYYCPLCQKAGVLSTDRSKAYREMVKHIKECLAKRRELEAINARLDALKADLGAIDDAREKLEGFGTIVTGKRGYLSGCPYVWSTDASRAFIFRNREQAEALIKKHDLEAKALELLK